MMRARVKGKFGDLTDFEIEAYLTGELSPEEARRVEEAAASSGELAGYLRQRQEEREAFFRAHPVLPQRETPSGRRFTWPLALAGAAAVLAAVVLAVVLSTSGSGEDPGGIRSMGAFKTTMTVRRGERTFVHRQGVPLREGDQVRLSLEAPASGFLTVLGQAGAGPVEVYYDGVQTRPGTFTVPVSLVLDGDVGAEEWTVILAPERKPASFYSGAIREGRPLDAPANRIRITKEASP
jgi:hypothetical protein